MNDSMRQKLERKYYRYTWALNGSRGNERDIVRFIAWLESKTDYRIAEIGESAKPDPEKPGDVQAVTAAE